jgi:hypothetical protein
LALALFEEDADDPDFDAGNDILVETGDRADAEWRGALDGLDPYVRYAALAGAECE